MNPDRQHRAICPRCTYDLRGTSVPHVECPECGWSNRAVQDELARRMRALERVDRLLVWCAIAAIVLVAGIIWLLPLVLA